MIDRNQIPLSWEVVKLGEVCKDKEGLRRGPFGSAIKKEFFVSDGYKVYEQSNAIYNDTIRGKYFIDEKKYQELINFSVLPGDLIVSCSGTLGRIAEIPFNAKPGVINQALLRIRLLNNIISKKFFLYFFRSELFQRKIFDQSQGTAMSNLIGIKDFKEVELLLPPLPEQHRIVSKIEELFSELDKGIENLKTAQQQLKIYRQAVLKWAFEGRLTHENVKDGELPEGWKWIMVKDIALDIQYGYTESSSKEKVGPKFLRITDIQENKVDWNKVPYCKIPEEDLQKKKLQDGDLVFARTGATVGKSFLIKGEIPDAVFASYLIRLRFSKDVSDKYVWNFFQSHSYWQQIVEGQVGIGQPNVNGTKLGQLILPFPPLPEQHKIVSEIETRLSVCDKLEETITTALQQSEALRQSILKKAFEGKLVEQNPNDEPASKLLERIKAESESNGTLKKKIPKG